MYIYYYAYAWLLSGVECQGSSKRKVLARVGPQYQRRETYESSQRFNHNEELWRLRVHRPGRCFPSRLRSTCIAPPVLLGV